MWSAVRERGLAIDSDRTPAARKGIQEIEDESRHPLEQSSSHAIHLHSGDGRSTLGQSAPIILALVIPPFITGWMGENHFTTVPTVLYGIVLLMAAIAYYVLQQAIIRAQGQDSILKRAIGRDWKGTLPPVLYIVAIVATLRFSWMAQVIFAVAALIWLIPDRRIEKRLAH